ncbi:MAG: GTP 3',8-cyclase MoaA [Caulobacterales bacterium]|nr:GTP 3',8-cyclase MoaA [Caulobacterales bacterium]MCA0372270.1 GTP 3',8-cyclase MoaA [Pseudomonadota bacterium]
MLELKDQFGRVFPYLRLSITEACNFRCQYCLPNGFQKPCDMNYLTQSEITNLISAFAQLGTKKIRLTGGEPTIRNDLIKIIGAIRDIKTIETIALTTNGYKLEQQAQSLIDAGLDAINVSIDSLSAYKFKAITGHDKLQSILNGLFEVAKTKRIKIKTNSVLLKGFNDDELPSILRMVKNNNITMRFIELMRTGDNKEYFEKHHLSTDFMSEQIEEIGFKRISRNSVSGPAREYAHEDYEGRIGIIAPYSKDFCASCNRLRISARGELKLCLFGDGGLDLRPFLQSENQIDELKLLILKTLKFKLPTHNLAGGYTGSTKHLAQIGG